MKQDRLELLVFARDATSPKRRELEVLARELHRFAPTSLSESAWRDAIAPVRERPQHDLMPRLGIKKLVPWQRFIDHVFPMLGLGIEAALAGRDAWTAAIAARILGIWESGKPPSLTAVCDAFAWRTLGLSGRAKRCPPEIRALFLQRELHSSEGSPDRQLRLFVARELETGTELRAMRDGLVRRWLQDKPLRPDLSRDVKRVAKSIDHGVFGDRKVFISSLWDELRREARWTHLTLADFKTRLVAAQRAGELELARADLVAAMDPALVAASEIRSDGASFHFIIRGTE